MSDLSRLLDDVYGTTPTPLSPWTETPEDDTDWDAVAAPTEAVASVAPPEAPEPVDFGGFAELADFAGAEVAEAPVEEETQLRSAPDPAEALQAIFDLSVTEWVDPAGTATPTEPLEAAESPETLGSLATVEPPEAVEANEPVPAVDPLDWAEAFEPAAVEPVAAPVVDEPASEPEPELRTQAIPAFTAVEDLVSELRALDQATTEPLDETTAEATAEHELDAPTLALDLDPVGAEDGLVPVPALVGGWTLADDDILPSKSRRGRRRRR